MAFTAIGIGLATASAASAGYQAKRGHDQAVQAKHELADEKAVQVSMQSDADAKALAAKELSAQQIAMRRRRALAMTSASDNRYGTIRTSPFGVQSTAPKVGGNAILGAA